MSDQGINNLETIFCIQLKTAKGWEACDAQYLDSEIEERKRALTELARETERLGLYDNR
jgi:hypothetical protein